jgi:hypothetical protein
MALGQVQWPWHVMASGKRHVAWHVLMHLAPAACCSSLFDREARGRTTHTHKRQKTKAKTKTRGARRSSLIGSESAQIGLLEE